MADNIEKLFNKMGLTEYESRVLSALIKKGEVEAPDISIMANVPKTRVYDVLEKLDKKQLVIPISGRPKKYKAIDPQKIVDILLNEKIKELESLKTEVELLKNKLLAKTEEEDYSEKVIKVKDKRDFIRILAEEIEKANNSIIGFSHLDIEHIEPIKESVKKAIQKNVNVMVIQNKDVLQRKGSFGDILEKASIKGYDHELNAYIIDNNKVILGISNIKENKPEYHLTIWKSNPIMIAMIKNHFDEVWKKIK
ncbi:MAG: hypothetical protein N3D73_02625 [Candidatus Diapherotrites archaeon]|nr:hypothetical protein [Candidatus Diapherotrites archaeon]